MQKKIAILMLCVFSLLLVACVDETPQAPDEGFEYDPTWVDYDITLTYASWANAQLENLMLDAFMEKYPNVTVTKDSEMVNSENPGWEGQLIERAAAGTLPDVFTARFLDHVYLNDLGLNIKSFVDQDAEKDSIMPAALESVTYDDKMYAIPSFTTPRYVLVNKRILQEFDIDIPSYDWTLDDYDHIITTAFNVEPGACTFGARGYGHVTGAYAAIKNPSTLRFNTFDGLRFNFTHADHREGLERELALQSNLLNFLDSDQLKEACEQDDTWYEATGQMAMFAQPLYDMSWFPGSYASRNGGTSADLEIFFNDIDLYPLPRIEGFEQKTTSGINFNVISPTIDDPIKASAAYELAKFMGFGKEGTLARHEFISDWRDYTTTLFFSYWRFPVTNDAEVWESLPHATSPDFALPGLQSEAFINAVFNGIVENNRAVPGQSQGLSAAQALYAAFRRGEYSGSLVDVLREMEEVANQIIEDTMAAVGW
jgi:multiple sugar transport system substrate-binding protein